MLLYVAGPYTAETTAKQTENVRRAHDLALKLWKQGHAVICPHLNMLGLDKEMGTEEILNGCFKLIQRCDAVVVLDGYEVSTGTGREIAYAHTQNIPVHFIHGGDDEVIPLHLTEQRCPLQCDGFMSTIMQLYRVHLDKNADYSPANILGTGEVGVVVRLWDKMARIMNLVGFDVKVQTAELTQNRTPKNESLEDSFLDMSCYAVIAKLLKEDKWGK